jgi:hypothetical protein
MTDVLLITALVLVLTYDAWKDQQHRKQVDRLSLLLKAKDVPEFLMARDAGDDPDEPTPEDDQTIPLEDATPEEALAALKKQ